MCGEWQNMPEKDRLEYKIKVLTMMSLVNKYSLLSEIKQENINEKKSESDSESISEANK